MTIREYITEELNKVSKMDRAKKWDYYKTYYKWPSIILLIGIILFAWFVKDTFFKPNEASMGCAYSVMITDDQKEYLTDGYLDAYGLKKNRNVAYLDVDNMFEGTEQKLDASGQQMALIAQIAGGQIHYLILDEELLNMYSNSGIYCDLSEVLPGDVMNELTDSVYTLHDPELDIDYKAAIDLNSIGFLEGSHKGYLVFTIGIPDEDYPLRLYRHIRNWKN